MEGGKTLEKVKELESPFDCREPKSLSSMIKALTVYLVYYELKSATINDAINQSINDEKLPCLH